MHLSAWKAARLVGPSVRKVPHPLEFHRDSERHRSPSWGPACRIWGICSS